jgi:plastocyanin domain-containing protein
MTQTGAGYVPNSFTIQKGVPVRWIIDSKNPQSCAGSIVMPSMNIGRVLQAGENVIEFTPTQNGNISFTCSMGMYRGNFQVVTGGGLFVTRQ